MTTPLNLDAAEYSGLWWLPATPEQQVAGVLRFDPGASPVLHLNGAFDPDGNPFEETPAAPIIQGVTDTGTRITLLHCYSSHFNLGAYLRRDHRAKFALIGRHFDHPDDVAFPAFEIRFTNLDDWTMRHGFSMVMDPATPRRYHTVSYIYPPDLTASIGEWTIALTQSLATQWRNQRAVALDQVTSFRVALPQPAPLTELLKPLWMLQTFVALGTRRPVHVSFFQGLTSLDLAEAETVQILYRTSIPHAAPRLLLVPEMLFILPDLDGQLGLEPALRNWAACHEVIRPVLDLYFSVVYGPTMYRHQQFLSLAQALESYHREVYGGRLLDKDDCARVRRALTDALPADLPDTPKARLRERIASMFQVTLAERLHQLLRDAPPALVARALPDPDAFAALVRWTRNYLTHYDEEGRDKAARDIDLVNVTDRMRWLLEGLLLRQLGVSADKVTDVLARNETLKLAGKWELR